MSSFTKKRSNSAKSDVATQDYEADDLLSENFEIFSPRSQELRDFEAYNRTTLPLLVEANLRAIVESQIAPIEERVRAMVVDIVRTCQSTVARNFHFTIAPGSIAGDRMQSSSQTIASPERAAYTLGEPAQTNLVGTVDNSLDFFHEPPHLNAEASASIPGPVSNHNSFGSHQSSHSDSGYASLPSSCNCSCHGYSNSWNTANGEKLTRCVSDS